MANIPIMCCPEKDIAGMKFLFELCYDESTKELYFRAKSLQRSGRESLVKVIDKDGDPIVYVGQDCTGKHLRYRDILRKYASEFARTVISLENFKDKQYEEFFRP